MTAHLHYQSGNLTLAIDTATTAVRDRPADVSVRAFLAELLCAAGEFERADVQLETMLALDPSTTIAVGTWRPLLRAAHWRDEVFLNGATPATLGEPGPQFAARLRLLMALRAGNFRDALQQADTIEAVRQPLLCSVNGGPVADLRDADDVFAGIVELLTTSGKYYWVDLQDVESLTFASPERPLDLLWRRTDIALRDGTSGQVFLPVVYPMVTGDADARLGRVTRWLDQDGFSRGVGQRLLLAGDQGWPLLDIDTIEIAAPTHDARPHARADAL